MGGPWHDLWLAHGGVMLLRLLGDEPMISTSHSSSAREVRLLAPI